MPHSQNHATLKSIVKKKLEQGITDFKKFIDNDCYFVDKTRLIAHLIDHPSEVHLITRPRRFGKTLNLSMIRYFFESSPPSSNADDSTEIPPNAALFDGMSIAEHPQCREYMGQYPVIHLSFKDAKGSSYTECMGIIRKMLSNEYRRHKYLWNSGILEDRERKKFENFCTMRARIRTAPNLLNTSPPGSSAPTANRSTSFWTSTIPRCTAPTPTTSTMI